MRAVAAAHPVTQLAAAQFVDRHPGRLARTVPQRMFDHRHRRAVRFEAPPFADARHAAFDIGGVFADQCRFELQDAGFQVGLVIFRRAIAGNALIGADAQHRILADDGAFQIGDFHGARPPSVSSAGACCRPGLQARRRRTRFQPVDDMLARPAQMLGDDPGGAVFVMVVQRVDQRLMFVQHLALAAER